MEFGVCVRARSEWNFEEWVCGRGLNGISSGCAGEV